MGIEDIDKVVHLYRNLGIQHMNYFTAEGRQDGSCSSASMAAESGSDFTCWSRSTLAPSTRLLELKLWDGSWFFIVARPQNETERAAADAIEPAHTNVNQDMATRYPNQMDGMAQIYISIFDEKIIIVYSQVCTEQSPT